MGSLAIPLVLWGRDPPTHDISCILLTKDVKTLVTASRDGQICVWDFDPPKLKMVPRVLLVGHSAAVSCLAESSSSTSSVRTIASAAQNG
ncbi:WD40-repeat-containing domain [Trinorchestia longiramus]|nr:WD40-repeat-containing domain [Trinorchestia longiramus]